MLRQCAGFAGFLLIAVSAFGQYGTQWRTSADVQEGVRGTVIGTVTSVDAVRNRVTLSPDGDRKGVIVVGTDAVSTQYNGFGGTINGSPEIFLGSAGFANVRPGDRLQVRGTGRSPRAIAADRLLLLGRSVPADQTGVGQTRPPSSISVPAVGSVPAETAPSRLEGVVRQVDAVDGRVVMETDQRRVITVLGTKSTPVRYHEHVYQLGNLEPGDRIGVEIEPGAAGDEVRARAIDVVRSVQEEETRMPEVGSMTGKVTWIDRLNDLVSIDRGRGELRRIDLSKAVDESGHRVRAADMQIGDRVDMSGSDNGETFVATTVRFLDESTSPATPAPPAAESPGPATIAPAPLGAVTIYGKVSGSLSAGPQLAVRDDQSGQTIRLYVLEDFVVRTKAAGYTTADKLREGEAVVVKAYRDSDKNYVAQSIRLR